MAIVVVVAVLILLVSMSKKCKSEGSKLGVPYRCKPFSSEPVTVIADEHYYGKRDGKCYEFLDYGNNMSIRRVSMEKCGEKEQVKKSDVVEDAVYTFND